MSLSNYNEVFELMKHIETTKETFLEEQQKFLKAMRNKQVNKDSWRRYRDCQALYSTAEKYLNQAHSTALIAAKKPTQKSITNINYNLSLFDITWTQARHYSFIGVLS